MSKTIDQRVVEMRFDNKHFETNVKTTMSTLDKFKEKLKLNDSAKGLENVATAAKKVNMAPLANAAETVRVKFSALEVMAVTALQNITNSALNAGKRIVSALTIDPIKMGFSEYETQINAVQTILANTESKGTTLDDVNKALDELNTYADRTIYNFTEMTRNIGTFTAAGVDLETSVAAIKGIANLAAVSGSTSQQASTAMYQLSQALASGTVKLMDWNSVVNAGMGGQVFQDALKETARVHGIAIDEMIEDEGSFRETLSQGWLSSEILTETLSKFTGDLNEAQLKTMGYTEEQIAGILKMGKTANDAATKVKTFTQLFDTLKEAAQSGWTQTWEIIVGDFEEAKALFTEVSDAFGAIIGGSADSRNKLLEGALSSKWSQLEAQVTSVGISFDDFQEKLKETAKSHGISIDEMIEKEGSLEKTMSSGWLTSDIISETLRGYTDGIADASEATNDIAKKLAEFGDVVKQVINGDFGNGEDRIKALTDAGHDYAVIQDLVNHVLSDGTIDLENLSDAQLENLGYTEEQVAAIKQLAEEAEKAGTPLNELIADMEKPSGRELLIDTFRNILTNLGKVIGTVRDAWRKAFPPMTSEQLYNIIEKLHDMSNGLELNKDNVDKLRRTFDGLFAIIDIITTLTGGAFKVALKLVCKILGLADVNVLDLTASVGDAIAAFRDWLFENNIFAKALDKLGGAIRTTAIRVKDWFNKFKELPRVRENIEKFKVAFVDALSKFKGLLAKCGERIKGFGSGLVDSAKAVKDWFANFKELPIVQSAIEGFRKAFSTAITEFKDLIAKCGDGFKNFGKRLVDSAKKVKDWFNSLKELPVVQFLIEKFKAGVSTAMTSIKNAFIVCRDGIKEFINKLKSLDSITLDDIIDALKKLKDRVVGYFSAIGGSYEGVKGALKTFKDDFKESLGESGKDLEKFATKIFNFFKDIKDKISYNIGFGEILAVGLGLGTFTVAKKIGDALEALSTPLIALGGLMDGIKDLVRNTNGVLKAAKFNLMASSFTALATGLILLAGAVALLTLLDQGKLWSAVGALAVLGGVMVALAAAMTALNKSAVTGIKSSTALLSVAGSLMILVLALKLLDTLQSHKILRNVLVLVSLMASLVGVSILLGKFAPTMFKGSLSLIAFAMATVILVKALKDISKIKASEIGESLLVLIGIMGGLALLATACKNIKMGAAVTVLAIVIALNILINTLDKIANVDLGMISDNLGAFITIFGMFGILMMSSNLAGKHAAKAGVAILAITVSLLLIVSVIKQLAKIDPKMLKNPLITIGILMLLFAGIIAVSKLAGENAVKAGVMLLMMAGALAIVTLITVILSKLDPDGLWRAVGAIAALEACFAALILITKYARVAKTVKSTLITLVVAIGILAAALVALSLLDQDNVTTATVALSAVIGMFALLIASTKLATKATVTLILMTAIVAVLGGILYLLAGLPVESTLAVAASLSILLLSLSAACLILAGVGATGPAGLVGIGILAAVIVAVGALMIAIGALVEHVPKLEEWLDKGLPILEKIGYGLGSFFGNIVGGFAAGAASGLPSIADSLSLFMLKLQPFLDGVRSIDAGVIEGVGSIVAIVLMLTAANLINSIASWMTGEDSILKFAAQLPVLGLAIAKFSDVVKDRVDEDAVKTAANAGKLLTELANTVPNTGGLLGFFVGNNDIGPFAAQLPILARAIVDFSDVVKDKVDKDSIETAANAGKLLTELAKTVPNTGGLLGFIVGNNDIGVFAAQLPILARAIVDFSEVVKGRVDVDSVETAMNAGKLLTELAKTVPNTGGLLGFIVGDNDIGAFAAQLPVLARAIVDFSEVVKGKVDVDSVETAMNAGNLLIELAHTVPNTGGLFGFIVGNNDIGTFAIQLPLLARAIVDFSEVVKGKVDVDSVETATNAGKLLTELSSYISDTRTGGLFSFITGKNMTTFAMQLPLLARAIADFSNVVDEGKVDEGAVETATNAGEMLTTLSNHISETKIGGFFGFLNKGMKNFGSQLKVLGEGIVDFSNTVKGRVSTAAVAAATNAGELIATLSSHVSDATGSWITNLFGGDKKKFENFKEQMPLLGEAIVTFSNTISGKIDKDAVTSAQALSDVLNILSKHIGSDTKDITGFGSAVKELGKSIYDYYESISAMSLKTLQAGTEKIKDVVEMSKLLIGVDTDSMRKFGNGLAFLGGKIEDYHDDLVDMDIAKLTTALVKVNELIDIAKNMSGLDTSGMTQFGTDLKTLGVNGIKEFVSAFNNADEEIKTTAKTMLTKFSEGANGESENLKTTFVNILRSILKNVLYQGNGFKDAGTSLTNKIASGVNANVSVQNAFMSLVSSSLKAIREKYQDFHNAGAYVVDGFAAGISANSYKAAARSKAMAEAAVAAARGVLAIRSPSKVFYGIGRFSGIGFVNALDDYSDKSYDAGRGLADSARSGLSNAISKLVDTFDNDVDTQPTIRPVLDLTNVESGARRLNTMFARTQAMSISANMDTVDESQNGVKSGTNGNTYQFTQNNYSPKALSRIEIYRQTKNQFSAMERMVEA